MNFQITVRHGAPAMRYHTQRVEADDLKGALVALATELPPEVLATGDLVEIRTAVDPDSERPYSQGPFTENQE